MKKEQLVEVEYIKKATAMIITVIGLIIGFALGIGYSSFDKSDSIKDKYSYNPETVSQEDQHDHSAEKDSDLIVKLKKMVESNPKDAHSWKLLGDNYFDKQMPQDAIYAYKKYIEIIPDDANVWTDLGVMYRRIKKPDEAITAFDNAIKIDPKHETCRFNKGIVLMHDLNDIEGAIKTWEILLTINPSAKAPTGKPLKDLIEEIKK